MSFDLLHMTTLFICYCKKVFLQQVQTYGRSGSQIVSYSPNAISTHLLDFAMFANKLHLYRYLVWTNLWILKHAIADTCEN